MTDLLGRPAILLLTAGNVADVDEKVRNIEDLCAQRGLKITVTHRIVEEGMYSASQFTRTVELSRTGLCEVLEGAGDSIFTVNFNKQLKEKEVADEILAAIADAGADADAKALAKKIKAAVKKGVGGELRTLVGYLVQTEARMGRSQVIDLEAPPKQRRP